MVSEENCWMRTNKGILLVYSLQKLSSSRMAHFHNFPYINMKLWSVHSTALLAVGSVQVLKKQLTRD